MENTTITQQIAAYLSISEAHAAKIRDHIDENDMLDWSEATLSEVHAAYREAFNEVFAS